jgi:hypothetical protein
MTLANSSTGSGPIEVNVILEEFVTNHCKQDTPNPVFLSTRKAELPNF